MPETILTQYIQMYLNGMIALSEFKAIINTIDNNDTLDSCNMDAFDNNAINRVMGR